MADEKMHLLQLTDREQLNVTGVSHVASFNDAEIVLATAMGTLVLKGEGLKIVQLDVEKGNLSVEGFVVNLLYMEQGNKGLSGRRKGLWQRILK